MLNRGTFRRASSHIPPRPRSRSDTSARALTLTAVACVHGRHIRPAMKTLGDPPRKGGSGRSPPEMFWNFGVSWLDLKHFYSKLYLVGLQFSRVILLHIRFSSTAITNCSFKALKYLALELLSLVPISEVSTRYWAEAEAMVQIFSVFNLTCCFLYSFRASL